jgi:hypothetical protein
MLAKRIAPLTMALLIAASTGNAYAGKILSIAPSAASESAPQKRQGLFKSLKVGFQAYREHRKAQGPGLIKRALTKLGDKMERLGDRIANRSEKIAKGAVKMSINVSDTGRAAGKTLLVKPIVGTGKFLGKIANTLFIKPVKAVARGIGKVNADIKAEKQAIRADRLEGKAARQMAKSGLTDKEIEGVAFRENGKFYDAAAKAIEMRKEQRIAASHAEATKDGSILGLKNRPDPEARIARKLADRPISMVKLHQMAEAGKITQAQLKLIGDIRASKSEKDGAPLAAAQ